LLTYLWIKILGTLIPWIWNHVKGIVICAIMIALLNLHLLSPLLVCCLKSLVVNAGICISTNPLNWWRYFLSRRRHLACYAKINHLILNLSHRLLHMLHWRSRIILYLIRSSTLSLLRWTLNYLDIIISSWCCFLTAGTDLISPLGRRIWNVVIDQPTLTNWKPMNHLFHGVVECVQENFIMARHGITNRFVYNFRKETSVFSFNCICLPMQ